LEQTKTVGSKKKATMEKMTEARKNAETAKKLGLPPTIYDDTDDDDDDEEDEDEGSRVMKM
jgi:hypothetical protein